MNLGVQYYRAPFPEQKYWEDDFKPIKDSGLNTVQLWVLWGWVESRPGKFVYDDYDQLMALAEKNGLGVVLSTIAEIQPYWIHREIPGSEMIDHRGHKVISSNRGECHFGCTPGGCTDNPEVWKRMSHFLAKTVEHFRGSPVLRGWDCWNELRWNVNADNRVCYCEHSLAAFHQWLDQKYGGLDGLNRSWKRRYGQWDEVWPGKMHKRPYTEMMAWQHFITSKCDLHGARRYEVMKKIDPDHPITVHAGDPAPFMGGWDELTACDRGNDWFFADATDGIGCSSFPKWQTLDDADFGLRIEMVKSAARDKLVWLSEVQGGRASLGFEMTPSVDARSQQRWIWNGLACGADTILFWCWRDEVFGTEAGGFGLIGRDGLAEERLAAMKITGGILDRHRALFEAYQPDRGTVGALFSPQSYYQSWSEENHAGRCREALMGYLRALVKNSIPFAVVEEEHLEALEGLEVFFLPRANVTTPKVEKALIDFVQRGGTLVCESEAGSFTPEGFYNYPHDRFIAKLCGLGEVGRRFIPSETASTNIDGQKLQLRYHQWVTPWETNAQSKVWATHPDGAVISEISVGKGRLILAGSYFGAGYREKQTPDFEKFVGLCVARSGWKPRISVAASATPDSFYYIKSGLSGKTRLVFIFFPPEAKNVTLRFEKGVLPGPAAVDLITGHQFTAKEKDGGHELGLDNPPFQLAVLFIAG